MLGTIKNTFQEPEVLDRGSPRGLISAWSGGYFTNTANGGFTNVLGNSIAAANTYLNPLGWYVCDGAEVNEIDSIIFNGAGRHVPNITDDRFLMGGIAVGNFGGSNFLTDHTHAHTISATQAAHTHVQDSHNHLQDAHNHTQNSHNHLQDSHNHLQDAHNHIQNSHNHTQDAHLHGISDPGHRHQLESWYGDNSNGSANPNNQGYGSAGPFGWTINTNYVGTGISILNETATNQIATATNIATTATNQITTATNISTTATNQITTATNIATTATNQSAQPLITVTGTIGSGSAATSTENRPKYLSCLYIIKVK